MESTITKVIKVEECQFDTQSVRSSYSTNGKFNFKDRQGVDIFNWSNHKEENTKNGKKKIAEHIAQQSNGQILHWATNR